MNHLNVINMKRRISEPLGGRGNGALFMEKRASGVIEAYYRYTHENKDCLIKIGKYKQTRAGSGYTLAECRQKASDLAAMRRECGGDLKAHLQAVNLETQQRHKEAKRQAEVRAKQGTLEDLCNGYVATMRRQGKKTADQVEKSLERYVLKPFPDLAATKAREVTVDDVVSILRRMIEAGITTTSNRLRSFLHAAYVYGMKSDNDPREQVEHGKRFMIEHNPVAAVPRQADFERVRERYLSHEEIKHLWHNFNQVLTNRSPVFGLLLRFMLATGGNRPEQLSHCTWSDFDTDLRVFTFIERKGKSGRMKKRVMPLSDRALEILKELKPISGGYKWPFCITGKAPLKVASLSNRVQEYCMAIAEQAKGKRLTVPEAFTPKDIRTTATNLLIECRVPQEQRFLIQSREDGSIESKHYDHSDRLPEKREALKRYDAFLGRIVEGKQIKLVDLNQCRQVNSKD